VALGAKVAVGSQLRQGVLVGNPGLNVGVATAATAVTAPP
jgi:hypothetical protein